jgi:LPXTG-motif cell wall-anchored protein
LAASGVEVLTESKYYLKEVKAPDGYQVDENVYEIGLEYFTQYDESGKVTKAGKTFEAKETPETVGVLVQKTDSESGNVVKGAGFAVFKDAACTQRVLMNGDTGAEVPVFYYDEDLDGAASEKFVKQQDMYYVKEVVVPDGYRDDGKVWEVKPDYGSFDTVEMTNTPIRCDVSVDKKDKETSDPQGDARLSGATYGLYALETVNYPDGRGIVSYAGNDNITSTVGTDFYSTGTPANAGTLLATVKTDEAGNFNFGNLYYGKYYIQEIEPSEGYLLDETKYEVDYSKEPNTHQNISVTRHVVETVKKQPFEIIKVSTDGDDTETNYVEGAEFTVKLQSEIDKVGWDAAKVYDTLVTDEKGYACSKELPYGTYLVKETKVPHNLYKTDDFTVEVTEDSRTPQRYRILNDAPFKAYIRMVKKDAESGNTICLSGVTFKIRNTDTDEYVEQKVGKDKVSEFTTDDSGTITTPLKLKYGNYQVEEITAPNGYLISEEEFPFVVEKDGAVKVEEDSDGDPVIEVVIQDTPVKGSISITKAGEVLTGTEYDTIVDRIMSAIDQEDRSLDFIYEEQNLAGAVFQLIAAEDIYTPDHQKDENGKRTLEMINGVPASAGAVVATLTTDENGEASMEDLPLGKYQVVEIEAPKGFVLCDEPFPVELTYKDDHTDVVYGNADFVNERVKTKLSVIKTDGVTKNPVEGATYGVFAKEDILDVNGEVAVKADTMVDTAVTTASGQAIFAADLPLANYYVKEVESPEGYVMDDTVYDVDFTYKDPLTAVLEKEITVEETPIIVEVSKTDITTGKELKGATLEVIDSDGEVYASWVTDGKPHQLEAIPAGDYTLKETASPYGYLIANEVEFTVEETGEIQKVAMSDERVKGAVEIYKTDSKTKSPIKGVEFELRNKDGKVLAKLITDKKGYAKTDLLDIGTYDEEGNFEKDIPYYVVETKAAKGYVIDTTPHEVLLQYDDSAVENVVYTLKLKNKPEKPKLPQTGGDYKPWLFGVAGGFLIGAGIYLNRRRKRRKV